MAGSEVSRQEFEVLAQQASALSAAVHALLATASTEATVLLLQETFARHEAALTASRGSDVALEFFRSFSESLVEAASIGVTAK